MGSLWEPAAQFPLSDARPAVAPLHVQMGAASSPNASASRELEKQSQQQEASCVAAQEEVTIAPFTADQVSVALTMCAEACARSCAQEAARLHLQAALRAAGSAARADIPAQPNSGDDPETIGSVVRQGERGRSQKQAATLDCRMLEVKASAVDSCGALDSGDIDEDYRVTLSDAFCDQAAGVRFAWCLFVDGPTLVAMARTSVGGRQQSQLLADLLVEARWLALLEEEFPELAETASSLGPVAP